MYLHPPFGWGPSLVGADVLDFHADLEIKGADGEVLALQLTNGVWMNPFAIPGFLAPTLNA